MNTTVTVELVDTILGCTFLQNDLSATSLGAKLPCLRVTTNKQSKERECTTFCLKGKTKLTAGLFFFNTFFEIQN